MSKKKLEERKKKAREAKAKERVLRRRKAIRAEAKKHKEWALAEKKATKGIPIKGSVADRDAMILEKLKHNYAILEALNEEWEKEQTAKKELNQSLEAEGYKTMAEKLDYIGKNPSASYKQDRIHCSKFPSYQDEERLDNHSLISNLFITQKVLTDLAVNSASAYLFTEMAK